MRQGWLNASSIACFSHLPELRFQLAAYGKGRDCRQYALGDPRHCAGRSSWRGSLQGGFSAAVQVGQSVYVVDFGRGWADRYHQAGLGPKPDARNAGGFEYLKAGFITHMHADHIVDLPQLMLMGFNDGVRSRLQSLALGAMKPARANRKTKGPGPG